MVHLPFLCLGAAVTYQYECNSGHKNIWSNSRNVGQGKTARPYINILLIVYAFLTGLHFDQIKVFKH